MDSANAQADAAASAGDRARAPADPSARKRVLNVGGGNKSIAIPEWYAGWDHLLLDVDSRGQPDIVCDARRLDTLPGDQFDAVYCSHNLEHYYKHDALRVLNGMRHVLKPEGFAEIRVPDITSVVRRMVMCNMDIEDVLFTSPAGPITIRDVLYGWAVEIERSGQDFYAHKNGFTAASLSELIRAAGFQTGYVLIFPDAYELRSYAFRSAPTPEQRVLLGLGK